VNEASNIGRVLDHLPPVHEVLVVDGASQEGTVAAVLAVTPEARILVRPSRGKGDALRAGFAAATCDVIIMLDADGSMNPDEIPMFVSLLSHGFDVVKGSREVRGARIDRPHRVPAARQPRAGEGRKRAVPQPAERDVLRLHRFPAGGPAGDAPLRRRLRDRDADPDARRCRGPAHHGGSEPRARPPTRHVQPATRQRRATHPAHRIALRQVERLQA
jgi:glycosyltransferase involved in cell wall biosynthesis